MFLKFKLVRKNGVKVRKESINTQKSGSKKQESTKNSSCFLLVLPEQS